MDGLHERIIRKVVTAEWTSNREVRKEKKACCANTKGYGIGAGGMA